MTGTQRYQRWVKQQKGPQYPPLVHGEPNEWEAVQTVGRVPRWVLTALKRAAEQAGEPNAAVMRAWLMDAAEQWLRAHGDEPPTS